MKKAVLWLAVAGALACTPKPKAEDAPATIKVLEAVNGGADVETRHRLLYQGCSEIKCCARGCEELLSAIAKPEVDASQRATLLGNCKSFDYATRRHAGEALHPDTWIAQHWSRFLDALVAVAGPADRERLQGERAKAHL